eukprot:jgi/Chrzof1/8157/UNPLg00204.t1
MGKHRADNEHQQHSKKRRGSSSTADGEAVKASKLIRYAAVGRYRKVRSYLRDDADLARLTDSTGSTALHEACRHGHLDVAEVLLRYQARTDVQDFAGNTPAHVAAMHGHLPLLMALLQARHPPDVDTPNKDGITIRQLVESATQQANAQQDHQLMAGGSNTPAEAADNAVAANEQHDDERGWTARLREEMSDDEAGGVGWARYQEDLGGNLDDDFIWSHIPHHDDDWADRIWRDMQAKQRLRQRAPVLFGDPAAQAEASKVRQQRAAEAAARSARILEQERAKDANWREAMLREVQQAALPTRRAAYDAKWLALKQLPMGRSIQYQDIPWPVTDVHNAEDLKAVILYGTQSADDVRKRLRMEILQWHPDKFGAQFGNRLLPATKERVLATVKAVSQQLTAMLTTR